MTAHIAAIGTAVPDHEIHQAFLGWAEARIENPRERALFRRMAGRAGITRRWSVLPEPAAGSSQFARSGFYAGASLPSTAARMIVYADAAPRLARAAIADLASRTALEGITHLVVASCTGFVAPGIDQILAAELGLDAGIERTLIGFMGCYAAVAALRTAHHIVRSEPEARVLVVTVELSTLHLQETAAIDSLLAQLQFGDGAAAALVSADARGFALDGFFAANLPDSAEMIRWTIGDQGFAMHLSGEVPHRITHAMGDPAFVARVTGGSDVRDVDTWAVHAGGRSILDAVEHGLALPAGALADPRGVLEAFGNMSSATLMFVLARQLEGALARRGVAVAFGPGLAAEGFRFRRAA